jgi:uncharacterized membrane protein
MYPKLFKGWKLKNCHYCAEEIQDAAVKCRFCGEWLEKKEEETNDDMSARSQELTDQHLDEPSEKTSQDCLPDELDEIESSTEFVYSPLAKKPKWGWGWFLLIALIASGFQRVSYYSTPASFLIIAISPFLLLAFYFWYRWKLIAKNQYIIKIWHLSFKAGFITYILALVLVFLASFIGVVQERKDNQVFLTQFQGKVIQLKLTFRTLRFMVLEL